MRSSKNLREELLRRLLEQVSVVPEDVARTGVSGLEQLANRHVDLSRRLLAAVPVRRLRDASEKAARLGLVGEGAQLRPHAVRATMLRAMSVALERSSAAPVER